MPDGPTLPPPARRRVRIAVYVLIFLIVAVCIGAFVYREGEAARNDAETARAMVQGLESGRGTFYRLDPIRSDPAQAPTGRLFQGWWVLAEQPLKEGEIRDLRDILTSKGTYGRDSVKCFEPGMGFRLQADTRVLDLVVCLRCRKYVAHDGPIVRSWNLSGIGCSRLESIYKAHALP